MTLTRPAQGALLPRLVRTPSELTAANAASSWVESATFLTGPALSGVLIGLDGPGASVLAFGLLMAGAGALVARMHRLGDASGSTTAVKDDATGGLREVLAGTRELRALLGLLMAEKLVEGAIDVLVVVLAIRRLGLGASGPGYLDSMFGVGAVLGGAGAVALIGRRRMTRPLLLAALVWGSSFIALGAWHSAAVAFGLLAVAGASRTVLEAAGRTILHRAVAPGVHGRIFGALEGLSMAGLAVGSLSVPLLVHLGGIEAATAAVGGLLIAVAIAVAQAVRRLDAIAGVPESAIALLRGSDIFAGLDGAGLEDLARALEPVSLAAGEVAVAEGEPGDRFYLIETGEVAITIAGVPVGTLGSGSGFGEIALLRDGVRTATATATRELGLQALAREPFLQALARSVPAARVAEDIVRSRVGVSAHGSGHAH